MKRCLLMFIVFVPLLLFSETGEDIYDRFVLDGISDEFTEDEFILTDSLGNSLESDSDSYWGENNDIRQIKVTWDSENLYVAVDACSWDNNVIMYFDIYDDYGLQDQQDLNTWMRNFKFYNFNPDFFLATWDTNTNPQFWMLREGQSQMADEINSEDYAGYDTGQQGRAMEAIISFSELYYNDNRTMAGNPSIRIVTLITAGGDYTSGPDCAPDNLGGMAQDSGQIVVIDNYAEILIDADGDGNADTDQVKPRERVTFLEKPPVKATALKIEKISFLNGKSYNRETEDRLKIRFYTNRLTKFYLDIYNLDGKKVGEAIQKGKNEDEGYYDYEWFGYDTSGRYLPYGIYITRVYSDSGEISVNEAFAIVK